MISGRPEKGGGSVFKNIIFIQGLNVFTFMKKRTDRFANDVERKNVVFKRLFFF